MRKNTFDRYRIWLQKVMIRIFSKFNDLSGVTDQDSDHMYWFSIILIQNMLYITFKTFWFLRHREMVN